jgi:hypothetical protein
MFKVLLLWSVLGANVPDIRDKFGTTFWNIWPTSAESALIIDFDKAGENQTERGGFPEGHSVSPCANWVCIFKSLC